MNKPLAILLLAAGLGGSCQRADVGPHAPPAPLARGQVVRYDLTYDAQGLHPRVRWIVQLASPLRVRGQDARDYTQVKVFGLADTVRFRPGVKFKFACLVVPAAQQTDWLTNYERSAMLAFAAGYLPNPEVALAGEPLL